MQAADRGFGLAWTWLCGLDQVWDILEKETETVHGASTSMMGAMGARWHAWKVNQ